MAGGFPRRVAPGWSLSPLQGRWWWRPARVSSHPATRPRDPGRRRPRSAKRTQPAGRRRSDFLRIEPSPSVGAHPSSENEPTGSGRIADSSVPALVCALVILLAAGLSAAFAGPVGKPYYPGDGYPHRPDTSPQRQRVNSGDDHRFTRWRLGLVGEILPRRGDIPADGRSGPAAAKVDSDRPRRFESADCGDVKDASRAFRRGRQTRKAAVSCR